MPKPLFSITDWSRGMVSDQTDDANHTTMYGLDVHTRPGVLRPQLAMDRDDGPGDIIEALVTWFDVYTYSGTSYLFAYDVDGIIYWRTGGAWVKLHTNGVASDGQGLAAFGASLYYTTRTTLGQLQGDPTAGGSYTDSFQTLSTTVADGDFAPIVEFAGSLYVGNGRYVDKLEADEVSWDTAVLTLPVGYKVSSMYVWNDRLVIGTKSGDSVANEKVFFWDGLSPFWELDVEVPKPGASALFNFNNTLMAFVAEKMYLYNGSEFEILIQLPKTDDGLLSDETIVYPGAVELWKEKLLFATSAGTTNKDTALNGVWSFGKNSAKFPNALSFDFPVEIGPDFAVDDLDIQIGALKVFGTNAGRPVLYSSWKDGANYGIGYSNYTRRAKNSYYISDAFNVGKDNWGQLIRGVKIELAQDLPTTAANGAITVKYRTDQDIDPEDDSTNWTTLGVIDNDSAAQNNQGQILNGVYSKASRIQFRLDIAIGTGTNYFVDITALHIY